MPKRNVPWGVADFSTPRLTSSLIAVTAHRSPRPAISLNLTLAFAAGEVEVAQWQQRLAEHPGAQRLFLERQASCDAAPHRAEVEQLGDGADLIKADIEQRVAPRHQRALAQVAAAIELAVARGGGAQRATALGRPRQAAQRRPQAVGVAQCSQQGVGGSPIVRAWRCSIATSASIRAVASRCRAARALSLAKSLRSACSISVAASAGPRCGSFSTSS